jgi:hypothetical protein
MIGAPPAEAWVPDFIAQSDVQGLGATLAQLQVNAATQALAYAVAMAVSL